MVHLAYLGNPTFLRITLDNVQLYIVYYVHALHCLTFKDHYRNNCHSYCLMRYIYNVHVQFSLVMTNLSYYCYRDMVVGILH